LCSRRLPGHESLKAQLAEWSIGALQQVVLPGTDFVVSRFIFGTASLLNAGDARTRQRLLDAVVDTGFTHFDTAPYYGFGIAERDLAPILHKHRNTSVTTKVGLYSAGGEAQSEQMVFLRKAAGRVLHALSRPTVDFSVKRARAALEGSLRRMGREQVEVYMLHEPLLPLLDTDEWLRFLGDARAAGKVRHYGLALTADRLAPFLSTQSALADLVQVCDSLADKEADILPRSGRPLQITYGYVSAARAAGSQLGVEDVLRAALQRNRDGAIIVSSRRKERLAQYAQLAAEEAR
jgi:D-threo-aldose 1-dehydrogenase